MEATRSLTAIGKTFMAALIIQILNKSASCQLLSSTKSTYAINTTLSSSEFRSPSNTTVSSSSTSETDKIPLYLGAFFPVGGDWDGSGIIPAVEMALDHINAREDILTDYELRMVWNDTKVSNPCVCSFQNYNTTNKNKNKVSNLF